MYEKINKVRETKNISQKTKLKLNKVWFKSVIYEYMYKCQYFFMKVFFFL